MSDAELELISENLRQVGDRLRDANIATDITNRKIGDLQEAVRSVEARLPSFVSRRSFWLAVAALVAVVALAFAGLWKFRSDAMAGCERANTARGTLREVVTMAVPPGRPDDLQERLLALPGVQPIDCAGAYPLLPQWVQLR